MAVQKAYDSGTNGTWSACYPSSGLGLPFNGESSEPIPTPDSLARLALTVFQVRTEVPAEPYRWFVIGAS